MQCYPEEESGFGSSSWPTMMKPSVSHDKNEESMAAKAEWFQSLTVTERMEVFVEFTDFIIGLNPSILDAKDAKPIPGRVRVIELPNR